MYWYNEIVFYTLSERYVCDWIELLHSQHCTRYSEQYNQYRGDRAQSLKDTKSGHCDIQYSHYDICDCHNDCFRTLKAVTVVLSLVITLPGTKGNVKTLHKEKIFLRWLDPHPKTYWWWSRRWICKLWPIGTRSCTFYATCNIQRIIQHIWRFPSFLPLAPGLLHSLSPWRPLWNRRAHRWLQSP